MIPASPLALSMLSLYVIPRSLELLANTPLAANLARRVREVARDTFNRRWEPLPQSVRQTYMMLRDNSWLALLAYQSLRAYLHGPEEFTSLPQSFSSPAVSTLLVNVAIFSVCIQYLRERIADSEHPFASIAEPSDWVFVRPPLVHRP